MNQFHDALATSDKVGLVTGNSYTLSARVYIPSASGILHTEIRLEFQYWDGAAWQSNVQLAADSYDAWQLVTLTYTLPSATGYAVGIRGLAAAALNEYFYVDDIRLRPDGIGNDHAQNFSDSGTDTKTNGNSWEL